jgi:hypothetical protein
VGDVTDLVPSGNRGYPASHRQLTVNLSIVVGGDRHPSPRGRPTALPPGLSRGAALVLPTYLTETFATAHAGPPGQAPD